MTITTGQDAATWWESNTWSLAAPHGARPFRAGALDDLVAAKAGRSISVVVPVVGDGAAVDVVLRAFASHSGRLVDEVVVSTDGTDGAGGACEASGVRVIPRPSVLPGLATLPGRGEVVWRSVAAATGDIVVVLDGARPEPGDVARLVEPLLTVDELRLVKGYRHRLVADDADPVGGGRVTELMVRQLIAALRPELSGVIEPLAGEFAADRDLLTSIPFAPGDGVDIGILLDTLHRDGIDAIGQVELASRSHREDGLREGGVTSRQIVATFLRRVGIDDSTEPLTQFVPDGQGGFDPMRNYPVVHGRPPLCGIDITVGC
ncbi:glucosyl-3-phosphoglycerate synthase [Gordonia polyisoprenivorans]|uniref:glucosyl-3-phosphoglycerate synthase n=1 Tax=Gordonia polyisoprenivorans TaxID=84595 RepID=UPI001AD75C5B|nr:glucosyl-3-phosphoglycerate synthase [Gordonia polyisoprenivorans]QTI66815.1 glucosyl-3-phosphoglycerate synthase [Gordonia polyisoprenivorans]